MRPRACLVSSRDSKKGRVLGMVGEGKRVVGGVRDIGQDQVMSGLVSYKRDFALTLSQKQTLESFE